MKTHNESSFSPVKFTTSMMKGKENPIKQIKGERRKMKKIMNFMKNNIDRNLIAIALIIVIMTGIGVERMENEWIETASAAIWIVGEILLVAAMIIKDIFYSFVEIYKEENKK